MKKILFAAILLLTISCSVSAQCNDHQPVTGYVSGGMSISKGNDFALNSYPSLEVGACYNNMSLGYVIGTPNFKTNTTFHEIKYSVSKSFEGFNLYALSAVGIYARTPNLFLEYGGGANLPLSNRVSIFVQCTNFDSIVYVSEGFTINF